jgi:hypothetical protein
MLFRVRLFDHQATSPLYEDAAGMIDLAFKSLIDAAKEAMLLYSSGDRHVPGGFD